MSSSEPLPDADSIDKSEALDGDDLEDLSFPPDDPLGVNKFGTTSLEEHAGDSVVQRDRREEPEITPADIDGRDEPVGDAAAVDGFFDGEDIDTWRAGTREEPFYVDVTDREAPIPAEEAALHLDDTLAGTDELG